MRISDWMSTCALPIDEVGNADAFPRDQVHTASLGKIAFRALRVLRQDGVPHRLGEQVTVGEPAGRAPVQLFHWRWGDGIKAGTKEMPQGLGEMEILAKAVAQQHARLMVEPVDQPGCLFADQGRGEREIELLYDDEAAHRGAKLGIERAQYLRPIVDGESIGPASLKGVVDPLGDRTPVLGRAS